MVEGDQKIKAIVPIKQKSETRYNLTVALRVRPLAPEEKEEGSVPIAYKSDDRVIVLVDSEEQIDGLSYKPKEKQFVFDKTFGPDATQKEVYEKTTKSLVQKVLDGYNATVFAYGATGAGKTYTMVGTSERPGVMARALDDLFKTVKKMSKEVEYEVRMSYLEIYNEQIKDLLQPTSTTMLELREDSRGLVSVQGLSEIRAASSREMLEHLVQGNRRRTAEPTIHNKTSSRSHAILMTSLTLKEDLIGKEGYQDRKPMGRLILIDLAGSEKANMTNQTSGQRLKEGAHINRSLLALGNVINTLTEKGVKYVNYRDSKLTRLLKDSLGGNSITVMIANVSPASIHRDETRNTLLYADRAKHITNKVVKNIGDLPYESPYYNAIIEELRQEITKLRGKSGNENPRVGAVVSRNGDVRGHRAEQPRDTERRRQFLLLKDDLISAFLEQKVLRKRLMEVNDKAYETSLIMSTKEAILQARLNRKRQKESNAAGRMSPNAADLAAEDRIRNLRDEVRILKNRMDDYYSNKSEIENEINQNNRKISFIEETLPKKIGSRDEREILVLLANLRDVESDKLSLESDDVLRNRTLLRQENAINTFHKYAVLSDKLILEQHRLIEPYKYPSAVEAMFNNYQVVKEQAHAQVMPLSEQAKRLGAKSWNRDLVETEREMRESQEFTKTLTYADLRRLKTSNAMTPRDVDNISISTDLLPVVTSGAIYGGKKTMDDMAVPSRNRRRARSRTPVARLPVIENEEPSSKSIRPLASPPRRTVGIRAPQRQIRRPSLQFGITKRSSSVSSPSVSSVSRMRVARPIGPPSRRSRSEPRKRAFPVYRAPIRPSSPARRGGRRSRTPVRRFIPPASLERQGPPPLDRNLQF